MPGKLSNKNLFVSFSLVDTDRMKMVLQQVLKQREKKQLPLVYRNELCISPNQFIHEYPNGKKFLIRQSRNTSVERTIREL